MRALITGATRGIGHALRTALESDGHEVIGTRRSGGSAQGWLALDVTDPTSVTAAATEFGPGPLDLLVCNAGVLLDRRENLEAGYPAAMWASELAVNVTGVFLTVQAFLPALRRAKGAKIAILSSQMGSSARAPGGTYIYRASKAAVLNLGRNLATDLRRDGISVGIYHPGWVKTDMGGSGAEIAPETSARDLIQRFAELGPDTTGCFRNHDGRDIPY